MKRGKPPRRRKPLQPDPDKVRKWVQGSRKQLPRGKPPARGGRLRQRGKRGQRERQRGFVEGPLHQHVQTLACVVTGQLGVHSHHVWHAGIRRDWVRCPYCVDGVWAGRPCECCEGRLIVGNCLPLIPVLHLFGPVCVHDLGAQGFAAFHDLEELPIIAARIGRESGLEPPDGIAVL